MDVLSYHVSPSADAVKELSEAAVPTVEALKLDSLDADFADSLPDARLHACIRMFAELGCIQAYRIPYLTLCRWLLAVRKNYRDVTYHNWNHAFNVAQAAFAMLTSSELGTRLSPLERFAILIACISHDLDHRGTNNRFEGITKSELAQLYSTSTMEHHHFSTCVMLLSDEGNNILVHVRPNEYPELLELVKSAILSTDIATYLKTRGKYKELLDAHNFDWDIKEHRRLLMSMVMTAADLSAVVRPFAVQHRVAEMVYTEFYEQGDKERQIGHTPDELYDKANVSKLPKSQLGFIDFICTPVCTLPRPAAPPIAARSRASTRLGAGHALCRAFLPR